MAMIGLKRPVVSPIESETAENTSYGVGRVLAKALSANININSSGTDPLWADNESSETSSEFSDGTIEIGIDDLTDANYAFLLGHLAKNVAGVDEIWAHNSDTGPFVGIGVVLMRKKNGIISYPARVIKKVQFTEPSEETTTKGKSIEWKTPTLSGNILVPADGYWKRQATFTSEQDAMNWVDGILHTAGPVTKNALSAKIATIEALTPATYTSATWGELAVELYIAKLVNGNQDAAQATVDAALSDLAAKQTALVTI